MAAVRQSVFDAQHASFTYLYLPHLDELSHRLGTEDPQVRRLVAELDAMMAELAESISGRARLVISADHGQTDVPPERCFVLCQDDPLCKDLCCQPTGEPAVPIFHVRKGSEESFAQAFRVRFGHCFALVTPDEVARLRLLGPGGLSPAMRARLGTFVGLPSQAAKLYIEPLAGSNPGNIGVHGGLSPAEMLIPLVLA